VGGIGGTVGCGGTVDFLNSGVSQPVFFFLNIFTILLIFNISTIFAVREHLRYKDRFLVFRIINLVHNHINLVNTNVAEFSY
jgi:hypothetical protein